MRVKIIMLLFAGLILALFCSNSSVYATSQNAGQKDKELSIRKRFRNLGNVTEGVKLIERYYVVNHSNRTIHIRYIRPECTCTSFNVSSYSIAAKDSVSIDITLDTRGKLGETTIYTIVKTDSEPSMHKLTLKANVLNKKDEGA